MFQRLFFIAFILVSTSVYSALLEQSAIESKVLIYSYIEKNGGELIQDETALSGLVNKGDEPITLKEKTWVIPNKVGTGFEIAVGFKSIPLELKQFDLQITYPEMTLPSGEKRSQLNRPIHIADHDSKYLWYFSYYFDFPYEASPGDWEIEIRSKGNLIHSSTFTVMNHENEL